MRAALAGLIFLIAIEASAQNRLSRQPRSNSSRDRSTYQQAVLSLPLNGRQQEFLIANSSWAGVATAATMLDVTTTSRCISRYADCQEGNPLLGPHPSTAAKLYGLSFSMLSGQMLASAWMRRKMPNGKLWMAPTIIAGAGHGLAAILNVRTASALASACLIARAQGESR